MRKLGLAAAALLMCTAANAGEVHEFAIGGGKVRVEMRDCKRGTCPWVTWNSKSSGSKAATTKSYMDDDDYNSRSAGKSSNSRSKTETAKTPAKTANEDDYDDDDDDYDDEKPAAKGSAAAAPPPGQPLASAPQPPPPAVMPAPPAPKAAPRSEDITARLPIPGEPAPAPPMLTDGVPASAPVMDAPMWKEEPRQRIASRAPEPVETVRSEPALAPASAARPIGPLGEWTTEDGEGRVLVKECGVNLCGKVSYARNPNDTDKNNPDRELRRRSVIGMPVLIDMKPRGERWEGKVYNAKDGKTYTAKVSMRNANTMRIEGCIMNGMLCGGQNWKRSQ